jgi:hypothetical protein
MPEKDVSDYNTSLAQSVPDKTVIKHDLLAVTDNYVTHALYFLGKEMDRGQSQCVKTRYV